MKITRLIYIIPITLFMLTGAALANDRGIEGVGGSLQPIKGEHLSVQMVEETVNMNIYPTYYDVTARFIFHNDGKAVKVKMGFPETGYGDVDALKYKDKSAFIYFKSYVDGRRAKVTRVIMSPGEDHYTAYWVKEVPFKAGQTRKVTVYYRSPIGSWVFGLFSSYSFTGGNWKGKVNKTDFTAILHIPKDYTNIYSDPEELKAIKKGNKITFTKRDWEADGYINIFMEKKRPEIQ